MKCPAMLCALGCFTAFLWVNAEQDSLEFAAMSKDDECIGDSDQDCSLNVQQFRGVKITSQAANLVQTVITDDQVEHSSRNAASNEPPTELIGFSGSFDWFGFGDDCDHPINCWNEKLDSKTFQSGEGLYYEFDTAQGAKVWSGQVQGMTSMADSTTPFSLASASKLFTAAATMITMQNKPKDWYPNKMVHEFKGWERWANFQVKGTAKKSNLTIHQLLTHTSGLPFSMRVSKEDLEMMELFYTPGTKFGYTLGHRVVGWLLRDYWMTQPEGKRRKIQTVQQTFEMLLFEPLGLSSDTKFSDEMHHVFGLTGEAGDASLQSTGNDLMKLSILALRKGTTVKGKTLIKEKLWNKWAVPNLLPGGKLTKDLVDWQGAAASWTNWNVGGIKESIMRQSGDYGWNYFGATFYDSKEIGWCGFFSSCLRVTYERSLAFVMMQRDVSDLKGSKLYLVANFDKMASSLECKGKSKGSAKKCVKDGQTSVFCQVKDKETTFSDSCPLSSTRKWGWTHDVKFDVSSHACYLPTCKSSSWGSIFR